MTKFARQLEKRNFALRELGREMYSEVLQLPHTNGRILNQLEVAVDLCDAHSP